MPCFSFSAPAVSPEEERREREELGGKYQQIQDEMRGKGAAAPPKHLNAQGTQCSLEDIQAEMAKMTDSEKTHLVQAMECAPTLVETESNHILYRATCQQCHKVSLLHEQLNRSMHVIPIF